MVHKKNCKKNQNKFVESNSKNVGSQNCVMILHQQIVILIRIVRFYRLMILATIRITNLFLYLRIVNQNYDFNNHDPKALFRAQASLFRKCFGPGRTGQLQEKTEINRKFEMINQKNIKNSHNSQSFKLFSKISNFFSKQRFDLFAVTNSEQRSLVKKVKVFVR